jgi:hypothetical protein
MFQLVQIPIFWDDQNNPEYLRVLNDYLILTKNYQTKQNGEFIGGMPVTLENDCFKPILRTDSNGALAYNMTLKVDGERYLLFLNYHGELYLIDRSLNFYIFMKNGNRLPPIDPGLVKPFLLDGELVKTSDYYFFDLLFYDNESFIEKNYYTRYDVLAHVVNNILSGYFTELGVHVKKWFPLTDILKTDNIYQYIIDETNKGKYKKDYLIADGIILQPLDTEYVTFGPWNKYNNIQFKWKPYEDQTMDFKIKMVKPYYWELLTRSDYPFTMPGSGKVASYKPTNFARENFVDSDVAEFSFNKEKGTFKLIRARPNKMANSVGSIMSIFKFIYNPFTLDALKPMLKVFNGESKDLVDLLKKYTTSDLVLCNLKNSVVFNKNEIKNIKRFYDLLEPNLELEFRIVKKGRKDSNVDRSTFKYLLEFLTGNYPFEISETIDVIQKNDRSEPTYRSTYTSFEDLEVGIPLVNEMKKQVTGTYLSDESKFFNLVFKLALSEEIPTSKVIGLKTERTNNNIRFKRRYSFRVGPLWRIDATEVKSGYSIKEAMEKNETFEIECEFIGKKVSFDSFLKSFSNLYILILQNSSYC